MKQKLERAANGLPSARSIRREKKKELSTLPVSPPEIIGNPFASLSPALQLVFQRIGGIPVSIRTLSDVDRPFALGEPIDPLWRISHIVDYGIFGERRHSAEFFLVAFIDQPEESNRWLLMEQVRKLPGFSEEIDRVWFRHFQHIQNALRTKKP